MTGTDHTIGERRCKFCSASLTKKRYESRAVFAKRPYCDRACMAKGMVIAETEAKGGTPIPNKACLVCGKTLTRKRFNGRIEDLGVFGRRKYCDLRCMNSAKVKEVVTTGAYRQRARKFRGDRCEACGCTDHLAVHHKDRNVSNNNPANLQTLCSSCHTSLHHSKGEISPKRYVNTPCKHCGLIISGRSTCHGCKWRICKGRPPFPERDRCRKYTRSRKAA